MANKNAQKLLIAAIIGVVTGYLALNSYSNMQKQLVEKDQLIQVMELGAKLNTKEKFTYLTVIRDLEPGDTVKKEDIKSISYDKEEADGLKDEEMVVGNVLLEPVKKGQILTGYMFTKVAANLRENPLEMRDGYRTLTLATSALDGLSGQMKAGMLVDVFSKDKGNNFVLSKVKILSLEPSEETEIKDINDLTITKAKTATFEVPLDKIQDFVNIYSSGKILLVMRPVNDTSVMKSELKDATKSGFNSKTELPMTSLPALPKIQTYTDPTIEELPGPFRFGGKTQTVEIIEASTKSHVTFD